MVIAIFGENCTGKSTIAERISERFGGEIMTGKDYLRLAKNQNMAKMLFQKKLESALHGDHIIYVISERDQLLLLPDGTCRILVTADLELIKLRFAQRMRGVLPEPVARMLERNHGCFDDEPHHIKVVAGETDPGTVCQLVSKFLEKNCTF